MQLVRGIRDECNLRGMLLFFLLVALFATGGRGGREGGGELSKEGSSETKESGRGSVLTVPVGLYFLVCWLVGGVGFLVIVG